MEEDKSERIRAIAYRIWEAEGKPEGQEARHWRMAEEAILQEGSERAGLVKRGQAKRLPQRE